MADSDLVKVYKCLACLCGQNHSGPCWQCDGEVVPGSVTSVSRSTLPGDERYATNYEGRSESMVNRMWPGPIHFRP